MLNKSLEEQLHSLIDDPDTYQLEQTITNYIEELENRIIELEFRLNTQKSINREYRT